MKFPSFLLFSLIAAAALSLDARAQSITSTTPQTNTQQQLTTANPAELTATFYDFTGMGTLSSIGFISVTLTLQDGNTAPGDFDFGSLFLALDNINTGIALNGFPGGGLEATLTLQGFVNAGTSAMLMAAFADSRFVGTIIRPGDTIGEPANDIFVGGGPPGAENAMTTLTLSVPEPSTYALIGAGLLLIVGPQVRRFRRNL